MNKSFGEQLSPVLAEIEEAILSHNADAGTKPNYTTEGFRAGIMIFMDVLMDKFYEHHSAKALTK